ncbi:MAG: hypothetical protein SWH68_03405 [Thermodesulfobacteriota bacterium]|nr:hypothetical protein [Thermodesulfobacteriota bacterium]
MPGIKKGADYLARKLLESSRMTMRFPEGVTTGAIGGQSFDMM